MAEDTPLWHWITDPKQLERKKCAHCGESMFRDRESAVSYMDQPYHSYCLITFLTKFHHDYKYGASVKADDFALSGWEG